MTNQKLCQQKLQQEKICELLNKNKIDLKQITLTGKNRKLFDQQANKFKIYKMKNPLELELQLKIKKANRFLTVKQYIQAIKQYTEGLELYESNRTYNQSVSEQFKAILYSLRANTYSLNMNSQSAEEDFEKSLLINPYSALTLSRRAKHFMKQKRFSEAIQDIDLALLYDPQNLSYLSFLNSIQNFANEIKDEIQRKHILYLITEVKNKLQAKPQTQSQSDQDSEQILNFSRLKLIDRKSSRLTPMKEKRKSTIEFKEDQILEYVNEDENKESSKELSFNLPTNSVQIQQKIKAQDQELKKMQAEQDEIRKTQPVKFHEHFILTKTHQKTRKSILRSSGIGNKLQDMLFISNPGQKPSFLRKSSISVASIKNIDGKVIKNQGQGIKFKPTLSQVVKNDLGNYEQIPEGNQKQNLLTRTTPKIQKRKSCLRNSQRFLADDEVENLSKTVPNQKKWSGFENIKNIDGQYHARKLQSSEQDVINIKIQSQSDDDNQHNIFGAKIQKEIIEDIDNTNEIPQIFTIRLSKKKSILRKQSILEGSSPGWKNQKKKSVLFKTG